MEALKEEVWRTKAEVEHSKILMLHLKARPVNYISQAKWTG